MESSNIGCGQNFFSPSLLPSFFLLPPPSLSTSVPPTFPPSFLLATPFIFSPPLASFFPHTTITSLISGFDSGGDGNDGGGVVWCSGSDVITEVKGVLVVVGVL